MNRDQIERLLPHVVRRAIRPRTPLDAILASIEGFLGPDVAVLDRIGTYFNSYTAPAGFVPYLAGWVDLAWLGSPAEGAATRTPGDTPEPGRMRELISAASALSKWRGTQAGLIRFIETATGARPVTIEDPVREAAGQLVPFHFRVRLPPSLRPREAMVRRIVESEKPAHVTYEVEFTTEEVVSSSSEPTREEG